MNYSILDDPYFNDRYGQVWAFENYGKLDVQAPLMKEMGQHWISQAYYFVPPCPYVYLMWQPWVKDYHGEATVDYLNYVIWTQYVWVDEDLKASMGY